jgi:fatty acid desaturase
MPTPPQHQLPKPELKDLWIIDGKAYDMSSFKHPGGRDFLMLGQGRDCTELFKSVHCVSNAKFDLILKKYEIEAFSNPEHQSIEPLFDFSKSSKFWFELQSEVRNYFESKGISRKADWRFWLACVVFVLAFVQLTVWWIRWASMPIAFVCGLIFGLSGFFIMHTGSHGGLGYSSAVNYGISAAWNHFAWWHGSLWLQHHVFGHHSYTGMLGKDPDVRNAVPVARKHADQKPALLSEHQGWLSYLFLTLLPNQFVGQAIVYMVGLRRKKLFGMPLIMQELPPLRHVLLSLLPVLSALLLVVYPLYLHGIVFIPSLLMYWTALGVIYWATTFPNHDTEGVHDQAEIVKKLTETRADWEWAKRDWGVLQLVNSSNFKLPGFLAQAMGGMNYQIEHHLFPSVHPMHYPELSKIVKRVAHKYQLPYLCYPTWFHALAANYKLLSRLATKSTPLHTMKAA